MSPQKTTILNVGGSKISLARVGLGLMSFTLKDEPISDEQAFESIKAGLDSVPPGAKMILNSGEFYGKNPREANLDLVSRFFEKYPGYADKAFLSVKGGFDWSTYEPVCSPDALKKSVDNILSRLRGKKRLDQFECARVDHKVPIEQVIQTLAEFVREGKFDYIGMSECKAETLRRANAVHPIAIVEIEVSPWSYDDLVKDVITTTKELGAVVLAYSPLGTGFLAGTFRNVSQLEKGDYRGHFQRFQDEYLSHNLEIVDGLTLLANKKGITAAQLCIAWVCSLGPHVIPIPGSSHKTRTLENIAGGEVDLTEEELDAITKILDEHPVQGCRYFPAAERLLWG